MSMEYAREYVRLRRLENGAKELVKDLNEKADKLERVVLDWMLEQGVTKQTLTVDGEDSTVYTKNKSALSLQSLPSFDPGPRLLPN